MERSPTRRFEALADGVFAIVMTLLVLELRVPEVLQHSERGGLSRTLLGMWPNYASYIMSFLFLSFWWLVHHDLFDKIRRVDGPLIWLNLLYLMLVALVPFSASLAARHWGEPVTGVVYGLNMLLPLVVSRAMFYHAARTPTLCSRELRLEYVRSERRAAGVVTVTLAVGVILSFVDPSISFAIYGALAVFYVIAIWRGREGMSASSARAADGSSD